MQGLFNQRDIEWIFLNGPGKNVQLPVNHGAAAGTMLFKGVDVNLVGCDFNSEVRNGLSQSVGWFDPLLNPETDDHLQEKDQESGNGKEKFYQVHLSSINHEFLFIGWK